MKRRCSMSCRRSSQSPTKPLAQSILPSHARLDALHIAAAAFHTIEILLTWNCKHIANASSLPRVYRVLDELGLAVPLVCTIEEMIGDDDNTI